MRVNLSEILPQAAAGDYAVAAFNIFGFEDARAVVEAAEALSVPVILMTNVDSLKAIPVEHFGPMLQGLATAAKVPVCVHLDHTKQEEMIVRALVAGYSSVMFDGSGLTLEENIGRTGRVVKMARAVNVSVEGEIGSVPYVEPDRKVPEILTDPDEAQQFAEETGVDAVAVAVGTVHRMTTQEAGIQFDRLAAISQKVETPLVIHGTSGVSDADLVRLARTRVAKFNIGTALRKAFGQSLRDQVGRLPGVFDRLTLFQEPWRMLKAAATEKIKLVNGGSL